MSTCICTVIYTWFYVGALTICMCVETRGLDNNYVLRRVLAIVKSVIGKSVVDGGYGSFAFYTGRFGSSIKVKVRGSQLPSPGILLLVLVHGC